MTPNPCTFCGSRHSVGYLFDRPHMRICRVCRDLTLTYLRRIGVPLTESNPFVRELCLYSHAVESAWFAFYNSDTQQQEFVSKNHHAKTRAGLVPRKQLHAGGKVVWVCES